MPVAQYLKAAINLVKDRKRALWNCLAAAFVVGGQEVFTNYAFRCPCGHDYNVAIVAVVFIVPAAVLLCVGFLLQTNTWRAVTGCCPRGVAAAAPGGAAGAKTNDCAGVKETNDGAAGAKNNGGAAGKETNDSAAGAKINVGAAGAKINGGAAGKETNDSAAGAKINGGAAGAKINVGAAGKETNDGAEGEEANDGAAEAKINVGAAEDKINVGAAEDKINVGAAEAKINVGAAEAKINVGAAEAKINVGAAGKETNDGAGGAKKNDGAGGDETNGGTERPAPPTGVIEEAGSSSCCSCRCFWPMLAKALIAPIVWLSVALLTGDYVTCAYSVYTWAGKDLLSEELNVPEVLARIPCTDIQLHANISENEAKRIREKVNNWLHTLSQFYGFGLIAGSILVGTAILCVNRCRSNRSLKEQQFRDQYRQEELKVFREEAKEFIKEHAKRDAQTFFKNQCSDQGSIKDLKSFHKTWADLSKPGECSDHKHFSRLQVYAKSTLSQEQLPPQQP